MVITYETSGRIHFSLGGGIIRSEPETVDLSLGDTLCLSCMQFLRHFILHFRAKVLKAGRLVLFKELQAQH